MLDNIFSFICTQILKYDTTDIAFVFTDDFMEINVYQCYYVRYYYISHNI